MFSCLPRFLKVRCGAWLKVALEAFIKKGASIAELARDMVFNM